MSCLVEEYEALYDIQGLLNNLLTICHKIQKIPNWDDCYLELNFFYIQKTNELKFNYSYDKILHLAKKSKEVYRKARGNIALFVSEVIKEMICMYPLIDKKIMKQMQCLLALCLYFLDESFVRPFPYLE